MQLIVLPPVEELQTDESTRAKWIDYSAYDAKATWQLAQALKKALEASHTPARCQACIGGDHQHLCISVMHPYSTSAMQSAMSSPTRAVLSYTMTDALSCITLYTSCGRCPACSKLCAGQSLSPNHHLLGDPAADLV